MTDAPKRYILDELSAVPVSAHSCRPVRAWAEGIPLDVLIRVNQAPREPDCVAVRDGMWGYLNQGSMGGFYPQGPAFPGPYTPPAVAFARPTLWQKVKFVIARMSTTLIP